MSQEIVRFLDQMVVYTLTAERDNSNNDIIKQAWSLIRDMKVYLNSKDIEATFDAFPEHYPTFLKKVNPTLDFTVQKINQKIQQAYHYDYLALSEKLDQQFESVRQQLNIVVVDNKVEETDKPQAQTESQQKNTEQDSGSNFFKKAWQFTAKGYTAVADTTKEVAKATSKKLDDASEKIKKSLPSNVNKYFSLKEQQQTLKTNILEDSKNVDWAKVHEQLTNIQDQLTALEDKLQPGQQYDKKEKLQANLLCSKASDFISQLPKPIAKADTASITTKIKSALFDVLAEQKKLLANKVCQRREDLDTIKDHDLARLQRHDIIAEDVNTFKNKLEDSHNMTKSVVGSYEKAIQDKNNIIEHELANLFSSYHSELQCIDRWQKDFSTKKTQWIGQIEQLVNEKYKAESQALKDYLQQSQIEELLSKTKDFFSNENNQSTHEEYCKRYQALTDQIGDQLKQAMINETIDTAIKDYQTNVDELKKAIKATFYKLKQPLKNQTIADVQQIFTDLKQQNHALLEQQKTFHQLINTHQLSSEDDSQQQPIDLDAENDIEKIESEVILQLDTSVIGDEYDQHLARVKKSTANTAKQDVEQILTTNKQRLNEQQLTFIEKEKQSVDQLKESLHLQIQQQFENDDLYAEKIKQFIDVKLDEQDNNAYLKQLCDSKHAFQVLQQYLNLYQFIRENKATFPTLNEELNRAILTNNLNLEMQLPDLTLEKIQQQIDFLQPKVTQITGNAIADSKKETRDKLQKTLDDIKKGINAFIEIDDDEGDIESFFGIDVDHKLQELEQVLHPKAKPEQPKEDQQSNTMIDKTRKMVGNIRETFSKTPSPFKFSKKAEETPQPEKADQKKTYDWTQYNELHQQTEANNQKINQQFEQARVELQDAYNQSKQKLIQEKEKSIIVAFNQCEPLVNKFKNKYVTKSQSGDMADPVYLENYDFFNTTLYQYKINSVKFNKTNSEERAKESDVLSDIENDIKQFDLLLKIEKNALYVKDNLQLLEDVLHPAYIAYKETYKGFKDTFDKMKSYNHEFKEMIQLINKLPQLKEFYYDALQPGKRIVSLLEQFEQLEHDPSKLDDFLSSCQKDKDLAIQLKENIGVLAKRYVLRKDNEDYQGYNTFKKITATLTSIRNQQAEFNKEFQNTKQINGVTITDVVYDRMHNKIEKIRAHYLLDDNNNVFPSEKLKNVVQALTDEYKPNDLMDHLAENQQKKWKANISKLLKPFRNAARKKGYTGCFWAPKPAKEVVKEYRELCTFSQKLS